MRSRSDGAVQVQGEGMDGKFCRLAAETRELAEIRHR